MYVLQNAWGLLHGLVQFCCCCGDTDAVLFAYICTCHVDIQSPRNSGPCLCDADTPTSLEVGAAWVELGGQLEGNYKGGASLLLIMCQIINNKT